MCLQTRELEVIALIWSMPLDGKRMGKDWYDDGGGGDHYDNEYMDNYDDENEFMTLMTMLFYYLCYQFNVCAFA